jgi:hypothetical protein
METYTSGSGSWRPLSQGSAWLSVECVAAERARTGPPRRPLERSGDRLRMSITLHMIAGTLAVTELEAAAIILCAAEAPRDRVDRDCPIDNLHRGGSLRRRAHAGIASTRRRLGLGPSRHLHPHSNHPSPQRTPIPDRDNCLCLLGAALRLFRLGRLRARCAAETYSYKDPRSYPCAELGDGNGRFQRNR